MNTSIKATHLFFAQSQPKNFFRCWRVRAAYSSCVSPRSQALPALGKDSSRNEVLEGIEGIELSPVPLFSHVIVTSFSTFSRVYWSRFVIVRKYRRLWSGKYMLKTLLGQLFNCCRQHSNWNFHELKKAFEHF